jgi:hypothetical protein
VTAESVDPGVANDTNLAQGHQGESTLSS